MRKTITLLFLLACCMVYGQKGPKIVPNWVLKTPIPGNDTYYYLVQTANGPSQREARNLAIAQAFMQADYFGGTAVNSASINKAIQDGIGYDVISAQFKIPLNIVCEFNRDNEDGTFDYYILCQIAKSGNIAFQSEPFNECYEMDISIQRMEEYKKKHAAEFKAKEREEARRAREERLKNNDYINNRRNKYVAWGIAGATYPWDLNTSIEFRYGNTVGFGLYGGVGMGFTKLDVSNYNNLHQWIRPNYDKEVHCNFSYSAGLKFFPYRGFFIGCGYGSYIKYPMSIECPEDYINKKIAQYNSDGYFVGNVEAPDYEATGKRNEEFCEDVLKNRKMNHGMQFILGYDFVSKMVDTNVGFYLGVKGGIIYDIKNKAIVPLAGLKLGLAFSYK